MLQNLSFASWYHLWKYRSLRRRIPTKEARGSWSMYSYIILFCGDQVRICAWSAVRVLVIPISFYDSFTVQPSSTRLSIRPIDRDIYRILIVSASLLLTWCFIGHNKTDKNVVLSLNLEHFLSSVRIQQGRTGICQNRGVFYCRKERREVTFVGDPREADSHLVLTYEISHTSIQFLFFSRIHTIIHSLSIHSILSTFCRS